MSMERSRADGSGNQFPGGRKARNISQGVKVQGPERKKTESLKVYITPKVLIPRPSITQGHHPQATLCEPVAGGLAASVGSILQVLARPSRCLGNAWGLQPSAEETHPKRQVSKELC